MFPYWINKIKRAKHLAQCLGHSKCSVNVSQYSSSLYISNLWYTFYLVQKGQPYFLFFGWNFISWTGNFLPVNGCQYGKIEAASEMRTDLYFPCDSSKYEEWKGSGKKTMQCIQSVKKEFMPHSIPFHLFSLGLFRGVISQGSNFWIR